jgi:hypothetical protein
MLWYNNPESVLAIQQSRREAFHQGGRHSLRLVDGRE